MADSDKKESIDYGIRTDAEEQLLMNPERTRKGRVACSWTGSYETSSIKFHCVLIFLYTIASTLIIVCILRYAPQKIESGESKYQSLRFVRLTRS